MCWGFREYADALRAVSAEILPGSGEGDGAGAVERRDCLQLSRLERVCESLDVPMWEVIRDAERAE